MASQVKKMTFHQVYKAYQRGNTPKKEDRDSIINPEKMEKFKSGTYYKSNTRPQKFQRRLDDNIKHDLMEYFHRRPEE